MFTTKFIMEIEQRARFINEINADHWQKVRRIRGVVNGMAEHLTKEELLELMGNAVSLYNELENAQPYNNKGINK